MLEDLLERQDHQISYKELAGMVIALHTFAFLLSGQMATIRQDNLGVLYMALAV